MLIFYPRDIGLWRRVFSFNQNITDKEKIPHKEFLNRCVFIEFLKENGVKLDDQQYPLEITVQYNHYYFGSVFIVKQFTTIGWLKEI